MSLLTCSDGAKRASSTWIVSHPSVAAAARAVVDAKSKEELQWTAYSSALQTTVYAVQREDVAFRTQAEALMVEAFRIAGRTQPEEDAKYAIKNAGRANNQDAAIIAELHQMGLAKFSQVMVEMHRFAITVRLSPDILLPSYARAAFPHDSTLYDVLKVGPFATEKEVRFHFSPLP